MQRTEEGVRSPEAGVRVSHELPDKHRCWEADLGPLGECLTSEPSLHPHPQLFT